ncbi:MAG: hypothetical protein ABIN67_21805 [Ferruginibacter sp.]
MKKVLLFLLLQLIWICLLVGGLSLYNKSLSFSDSYPTTITIKSGNAKDNTLVLDPGDDTVEVFRGRKVTWIIDGSSNVESFRIGKKKASTQIFVIGTHPATNHTRRGWGTVDPLRGKGTVFSYSIFWKMAGDTTEREFDPKLAVKSNSFAPLEWLIYIVYAVLGLLSFGVFRTAKK